MNRLQKITVSVALSFVLILLAFVQVHANDFVFNKTVVQIDNNATVDNTVHTNANSGGNYTNSNGGNVTNGSGGNSVSVSTGNAGSETVICNDVNHTVINKSLGQSCPSSVQPTATPAPQPTATPVPGCTSNCGGSNNGGGSSNSNNSSSGGSSNSSNGAVLGASTFAGTGTFAENLMNAFAFVGLGFLSLGLIQKMKKISSALVLEIRY